VQNHIFAPIFAPNGFVSQFSFLPGRGPTLPAKMGSFRSFSFLPGWRPTLQAKMGLFRSFPFCRAQSDNGMRKACIINILYCTISPGDISRQHL
jgi:hypothetical protein